jgi:hypothetical protein
MTVGSSFPGLTFFDAVSGKNGHVGLLSMEFRV